METFNITREEVIRRLRAKGQPIRLFGETDKQCKIRLRALELMEEQSEEVQQGLDDDDEYITNTCLQQQGQRNDYMRKLEEMEEGMRLEALKQKAGVPDEKKINKKLKKAELIVEPIDLGLLQSDLDRLFAQIYSYLVVSWGNKDYRKDGISLFSFCSTQWMNGKSLWMHGPKKRSKVDKENEQLYCRNKPLII